MMMPHASEIMTAGDIQPVAMETDGPIVAQAMASGAPEQRRTSSDASSGRSSEDSDDADSSEGSSDADSGSSSGDEGSNDDNSSDNETLAARHKGLKQASAASDQAVHKRRRSSSDSGSGQGRRKRRSLFPVIRKSQRCGKCHTCLNPQLKKACITVREQMMREAAGGGSKSRAAKSASSPSVTAASSRPKSAVQQQASPPGDDDKYTDVLLPFINSAGAISGTPQVAPFVKALGSFGSSMARTLPCTVLGLSSSFVLAEFMERGGVDVISRWMLHAMEEDNEPASQFLIAALEALKKLPVHKAFVQSTKSAKVIGALRKHDNSEVRKLAREIVALWMKVIPASSKPSTKPGEQRTADTALATAALPAAKRLKTVGQGKAAAAGQRPGSATSAKRPAAATSTNGVLARTGVGAAGLGIHVVSDNDLFKPKTPAARIGVGLKQQPQKKVQTLDQAEASRLLSGVQQPGTAAAGGTPSTAAAPAAGVAVVQPKQELEEQVQLQLAVNSDDQDAPVTLTLNVTRIPSPQAAAGPRRLSGAAGAGVAGATGQQSRGPTTSSVGRLPGMRRTFGAGLGARPGFGTAAGAVGESSITALLAGSWGQDAGTPAAEQKKEKKGPKKRVMWKLDRDLVAVRWFIKEDPPVAACKDAHLTEEQLRALQQQHHHQAFDQAARMEHMRERQLIEQQHKAAEEASARMREQIAAMQPTTEWCLPPAGMVDAAWNVMAGDDSKEVQRSMQSLLQLMAYLQQTPPAAQEPMESHQLLQPPNALFNMAYHDRNVKIIPLESAQAQQQQQQQPVAQLAQQQQPPPVMQQQQQGLVLQPAQPSQQQPQQVVMQPPQQQLQQGGQLLLQPQQQQQIATPQPPPQPMGGLFGGAPVSGPPSDNNQSQLLQVLQSLGQVLGPPPPQQQQPMQPVPQQMPQLAQQIPVQAQPVMLGQAQLAPGQMPSGQQLPQLMSTIQVLLPNGTLAVVQAPAGQALHLPPGAVPVQQQQQQQGPPMHVQQPGPYDQGPPVHGFEHQGPHHHPPHVGGHDYGQHRGPQHGGGRRGGRGGRGGGRDGVDNEDWRRNRLECKFFNTARGCQKGDRCGFKHVLPNEKLDVRDERRVA